MNWCKKIFAGGLLFFHLNAAIPEKVILCVTCRDNSSQLPEFIADVEKIGSLFTEYRIVAYENNSEDDTPSQLYRWKRGNPNVSVIVEFLSDTEFTKSIVNQKGGSFSLQEQTALARNKALSYALSQFDPEFSYILWMDPLRKLLSLDELKNVFRKKENWDAVFAYGTDQEGRFDDWEAFRDENYPFGPELMGDDDYRVENPFFPPSHSPWHPVYSAFGGFAIYRREAIQNCKYSALVTSDLEKLTRKCFFEGLSKSNPFVISYLQTLEHITRLIQIVSPNPDLPQLSGIASGVYFERAPFQIVWKLYGLSDRFPAVCQEVPLHASMYVRGFYRLFIDPQLVSVERDSHCEFHPSQDESQNYNL